jgi:hypothetical protein
MDNEQLSNAPQQPDLPQQPDCLVLQAQCDSLHRLLVSTLFLMVIISGTLWIFLMRQSRTANTDLELAVKPAWTNAMAQFQRTGPVIDETVKKFQEFARTNSDFSPILAKYGLKAAGAAATAPAPSKTPAATAAKK